MSIKSIVSILLGIGVVFLAACQEEPETAWLKSELYFGIGLYGADPSISEEEWFGFLDEVVTPEFPAGFSAAPLYGQWQGQQMETPVRLASKVIIILHPDTPEDKARIERIREGWNARYDHESVLLSQQSARVSF